MGTGFFGEGAVVVVSQGAMGTLGSALGRMGSGTSRSDLPQGGQCLRKDRPPAAGTLGLQLCCGKGTKMGAGI